MLMPPRVSTSTYSTLDKRILPSFNTGDPPPTSLVSNRNQPQLSNFLSFFPSSNVSPLVFPPTVLIDCPEDNWQSSAHAKVIAEKIALVTGGSMHIDVAIATHMHLDHVGYAGYGGFYYLIEKAGVTIDKFIDRDSGVAPSSNADCSEDTIEYHNMGTITGTAVKWICYATNPANTKIYKAREIAQVCSSTQIPSPSDDLTFTIVAADAVNTKTKAGTPVPGDHHSESVPPSENVSITSLLFFSPFLHLSLSLSLSSQFRFTGLLCGLGYAIW